MIDLYPEKSTKMRARIERLQADPVALFINGIVSNFRTMVLNARNVLEQQSRDDSGEPPVFRKLSEGLSQAQVERVRRSVQRFFDQQPRTAKDLSDKFRDAGSVKTALQLFIDQQPKEVKALFDKSSLKESLDKLASADSHTDVECIEPKIYPPSKEMLGAALSIFLRRDFEEFQKSLVDEFGGNVNQLNYAYALLQLGNPKLRFGMISRALLPAVCRATEDAQAGLIRTALREEKDALGDMPPIPREIYSEFGMNVEMADIDRWSIDIKVQDFISRGPTGWQMSISDWTGSDISEFCPNWKLIVESFEMARLVVSPADSGISNVSPELANLLSVPVDSTYVTGIIDEIECFIVAQGSFWLSRLLSDGEMLNLTEGSVSNDFQRGNDGVMRCVSPRLT